MTSTCVYLSAGTDAVDAALITKDSALKSFASDMGIPLPRIAAIGDSANDIPLLKIPNLGAVQINILDGSIRHCAEFLDRDLLSVLKTNFLNTLLIAQLWQKIEPVIRHFRQDRGRPNYCRHFEDLAIKWLPEMKRKHG